MDKISSFTLAFNYILCVFGGNVLFMAMDHCITLIEESKKLIEQLKNIIDFAVFVSMDHCISLTQEIKKMTQGMFTWLLGLMVVKEKSRVATNVVKEAELLSIAMMRLDEMEMKVNNLGAKPPEMPHDKEELLDAATRRVDALEAELISTKKTLHEVLMRQEELLAYIDSRKRIKFRRKNICW